MAIALVLYGCATPSYYDSGPRALFLSRHLRGYAWARSVFQFKRRLIYPRTVGKPEFLEIQLHTKNEVSIDSVAWYDPLGPNGIPEADWNAFKAVFESVSALAERYRWLNQWRSAARGREIELQLLGSRSEPFLWFATDWARERWRIAGLAGSPEYFVTLRGENSSRLIDIAFASREPRALVYFVGSEGNSPIRHPLDEISLGTSAVEGSGNIQQQYGIIEPSGAWQVHTYAVSVR